MAEIVNKSNSNLTIDTNNAKLLIRDIDRIFTCNAPMLVKPGTNKIGIWTEYKIYRNYKNSGLQWIDCLFF